MTTASNIAAGVADPISSPATMSNSIANTFTVLSNTQANLQAGFDSAMIDSSQNIGRCIQGILDVLEGELSRACSTVGNAINTIAGTMEAQIAATNGVIGLCEQRILRCQRRSTNGAGNGTISAADAVATPPPPQSAADASNGATASTSIAGSTVEPASSSCPAFDYPAPPTPEVLDTLVLLHTYGGGATKLSAFPAELFDPNNDSGVFFSTVLTPLTRGKITLYRSDSNGLMQTGDLYFNVAFVDQDEVLSGWVAALNMPPGTTETWTTANAYIYAVQNFGCNVVNREWALRGMPLPITQDCPPDAADALCGGGGKGIDPITPVDGSGDGNGGEEPCEPCIPICGITPGTGDLQKISADLLPNLDWLNPENWPTACDLWGRMTRSLGVDGSRLWPCVTLQEMMRNIYGR